MGSPEERLPSSRLVKAPLGMDLVPTSPKANVVSPVDSALVSGSPVMPVASNVRVKHFSFPPVLEDAPTLSVHAKVSFVPKSTMGFQREAIQLYKISRKELEKRLSIACSVFFGGKGGGSRIEVRDVGVMLWGLLGFCGFAFGSVVALLRCFFWFLWVLFVSLVFFLCT